jgi:hypothetical protein
VRVEFTLDRAGLFWNGLGISLHVAKRPRAALEAAAWWERRMPGSRSFRLGPFVGTVCRRAARRP